MVRTGCGSGRLNLRSYDRIRRAQPSLAFQVVFTEINHPLPQALLTGSLSRELLSMHERRRPLQSLSRQELIDQCVQLIEFDRFLEMSSTAGGQGQSMM